MKFTGSLARKQLEVVGLSVLWVVYQKGGTAARDVVLDEVEKILTNVLEPRDLKPARTGSGTLRAKHKWMHSAEHQIYLLRKNGYLEPKETYGLGTWVITDKGRQRIEFLKASHQDGVSKITLADLRESLNFPDDDGNVPTPPTQPTVPESQPQPTPVVARPVPESEIANSPASNLLLPYFEKKGYQFSQFQIAAFYAALKTKGFVILSGLSGTGKTKLAQHFAELFGDNCVWFESVRPDWRDSKNLLGFVNPLWDRKYQSTELLRFILRARSGARPADSSPRSLKAWLASKLETDETREWMARYREMWQRFISKQTDQMTEEDLALVWNEKRNGVTSIGQAAGMPFHPSIDELRKVTAIVQDLAKSPGQRLIEAMDYLRQLSAGGNHWARVLRALAVFDPEHVTTIANRDVLRRLAERLGYDQTFRIRKLVEAKNAEGIDHSFQFMRDRTDALVSSTDPILRAVVPWLVWEFYESEIPLESEAQPLPHFLILDEMNLAHVEYYFAEFLSVLESGRLNLADVASQRDSGELKPDYRVGFTRESIHLHSNESDLEDANADQDDDNARSIPNTLRLPPNLYIIGTVNVDETTFAFSPKVLDRAFTIEFRDVDLDGYDPIEVDESEANQIAEQIRANVFADFTRAGRFIASDKEDVALALDELGEHRDALIALNKSLEPFDLHFGYRVLDEIALFFVNAHLAQASGIVLFDSDNEILDAAVLMKVLPKIHGSRQKLEEPLTRILRWTLEKKNGDDVLKLIGGESTQKSEIPALLGRWDTLADKFLYPATAKKVLRMLHTLYSTGFASFA
ncbi:MAG: hypothetical protein HZC40_18250 [Chloroflexi bacterium]|nr:hypothetical protein [Chloroflexota bacterium]